VILCEVLRVLNQAGIIPAGWPHGFDSKVKGARVP